MIADALSPAGIFGHHVRYVVPLFQRPYVWTERQHWAPLWEDVRSVAEHRSARHFLGAIVVEQAPTGVGSVAVYHVVDGQQRLTTLQLLLDAAHQVALRRGHPGAALLGPLVRNSPEVLRDPDEQLKVWPTIADRSAFVAVMGAPVLGAPVPTGSVAAARAFFATAIEAWLDEAGLDDAADSDRLTALVTALRTRLAAVVIHLDGADNAQGVFETLNQRGAPLLAADLIKNLIFRVAQEQGHDIVALHAQHWAALDTPLWRGYVHWGRHVVPRIDVFLSHWLVARLHREVRADEIFVTFRDRALTGPIEPLLADLGTAATTYASAFSPDTADTFCYRVLQVMDTAALAPAYLWLMDPSVPPATRHRALRALESWVVRRWLAGLATKDTTGVVCDLLAALALAPPAEAGEVTEAFLAAQRAPSRVWPDDASVRKSVEQLPLDGRTTRPRLRMVLEAIEDHHRTEFSDAAPCERDLSVEHVMPLAWRAHWPLAEAAVPVRESLIHTLGNLTLVRWRLNAALANLPWTDDETLARGLGETGKRSELDRHSRLMLNAELVAANPRAFTEAAITERTATLTSALLAIWPRAAGGGGRVPHQRPADPAPHPAAARPVPLPGSPYQRLTDFLRSLQADTVPLTFQQLVDVMGAPLPPTARTSGPYWSRLNANLARAIADGGYHPTNVDLFAETVILARGASESRVRKSRKYLRRRPH